MTSGLGVRVFRLLLFAFCLQSAQALDPGKSVRQYSRTTWTQQNGLPQDTIRAIAQTADGYLWVGTDDGLARFDGYEFVVYKTAAGLPADAITALAAGKDGSLWVGTPSGLAQLRAGSVRAYTTRDGLPDNSVRSLFVDRSGAVWAAAGGNLSRFDGQHFTNYLRQTGIPMRLVRQVTETPSGVIYAAGNNAVAKLENGIFRSAFPIRSALETPMGIHSDASGNVWVVSSHGLLEQDASGKVTYLSSPSTELQTVFAGRDGNIWVGTNAGIARVENGSIRGDVPRAATDPGLVLSLFEDREGNLWAGGSKGLTRFRDDEFSNYGRAEGLPSDEPNALYQDRQGRVWVGFLDHGVVAWERGNHGAIQRIVPEGRIYSIRGAAQGDVLIAGREGLMRLSGKQLRAIPFPDALGRRRVFDAQEDVTGRIWLALPSGLGEIYRGQFRLAIAAGPLLQEDSFITLALDRGGSVWAGTVRKGLWQYTDGKARQYTVQDGLPSDSIRSLLPDKDGTLWIGTVGGGLSAFENGAFFNYGIQQGMLNDNVTQIVDEGEFLWLGTMHGIARVSKKQLRDFREGRISTLHPQNYGVADGLASAQSSLEIGAAAYRNQDGSLWFATARGIAVFDPRVISKPPLPPEVRFLELTADDRRYEPNSGVRVPAGSGRAQIRYSAIHLRAPESVSYRYKLEGLDPDWVRAENRRIADYNSLNPGRYRFLVRAELPQGAFDEGAYEFGILPHYYQTNWFRALCGVAFATLLWFGYQSKQRQVRLRYAAVLEERARLAREVHDTLAQGFVGVASQLDAAEMFLPHDPDTARGYLEIARRMARHSLTETRRSVQDLRASALDDHDLGQALESGVKQWTEGSSLEPEVAVSGDTANLPSSLAHQVLRIAQEAVANVMKHAAARKLVLHLRVEAGKVHIRIADDGKGFDRGEAFHSERGHFGLIGMRERAKRLGGTIEVHSRPGDGTEVDVTVPLRKA